MKRSLPMSLITKFLSSSLPEHARSHKTKGTKLTADLWCKSNSAMYWTEGGRKGWISQRLACEPTERYEKLHNHKVNHTQNSVKLFPHCYYQKTPHLSINSTETKTLILFLIIQVTIKTWNLFITWRVSESEKSIKRQEKYKWSVDKQELLLSQSFSFSSPSQLHLLLLVLYSSQTLSHHNLKDLFESRAQQKHPKISQIYCPLIWKPEPV